MPIYLVRNLVNDKLYVGQTVREISMRWRHHMQDAKHGSRLALHRAIRKYGPEQFTVEQLSPACTEQEMNNLERIWIVILQSTTTERGYNLTYGGDGHIVTDQTRQHLSESHKGQRAFNKGQRLSTKHRAGLKKAWANRPDADEMRSRLRAQARTAALTRWGRKAGVPYAVH